MQTRSKARLGRTRRLLRNSLHDEFKDAKKAEFYYLFSNYCGLGGQGTPLHRVDAICKKHDENYGLIMKAGENPYFTYNWADKVMLEDINAISPKTLQEAVAYAGAKTFLSAKFVLKGKKDALGQSGMEAEATDISDQLEANTITGSFTTPQREKRPATGVSPLEDKNKKQKYNDNRRKPIEVSVFPDGALDAIDGKSLLNLHSTWQEVLKIE